MIKAPAANTKELFEAATIGCHHKLVQLKGFFSCCLAATAERARTSGILTI
jgi:hypothetical protein